MSGRFHEDGLSTGERATAARLRKWSARPLYRSNLLSLAVAGLSALWLFAASAGSPDRLSLLRQAALLLIAFHGMTYVIWLRALRRLSARGVAEAGNALAAYTDPRRLTNLDLAMFWTAAYAFVPHLV